MRISVLASGSSGNSTFIESDESNILIDAGISTKRIKECLSKLGKDLSEIDGIFVTHEHTDHIKGLERMDRFDVPIYMNQQTLDSAGLKIKNNLFENDSIINLRDLSILPIPISHDATDPCGFEIRNKNKQISYFTDIGMADQKLIDSIKTADGLVLETNHDIDMLLEGRYPYHLKQRILGEKGHLSNIDAGLLVQENASDSLKNVFLAHLSENNNTQELAMNTFTQLTKDKRLNSIMTKQKEMTEFIRI